ncbi:MAG: 2-oxo acid dehydrogenase subunit E2 [Sphingobium sp.]|jgi:2-oxoglutarate dehydrogenase E2 component (dihydrolipoamide succinyltransferase)|nr:2-oxo acid dehydrogenase subunit E2 [Sphingobium sp.]MCI1271720.1 2-oxo acid dehydrogenase subunit E2 [Sphingobium sp.]MCI1756121.1 2-oxo acid dehydrogenase subunit E2 [Sphingobium sp.]MCI2053556.1 2-oxo acid dehydrogenase subunit E2 [Sphingobium sp.]
MGMIDILVPAEQEGTKAIVRSWLAKVGQPIGENDPLVELETDKVTQEVPSPASGVLVEILLDTDAQAEPGALLGRLRIGEETAREEAAPAQAAGVSARPALDRAAAGSTVAQALSPAVRRAVREHRVDPAQINGTGRGGRITRADVDAFVAARATAPHAAPASAPAPKVAAPPPPPPVSAGGVTSVPHDRMRLAIAENMLNSVTIAPHVTAMFECDFSAIMAHRRKHKAAFEKEGANLTFTAYFLAAAAQAMKAAPAINSRWFDDRLELYDDVNIGIGTALGDKGLVVPVVRQCQRQSLLGIAHSLTDLVARARDNRLTPADMKGGTFTISNHGVSGSLFATPIVISQPQSAILGIGKTEKRVVVREVDGVDTIQIRPMAYVSLTIDHRVVDGHQTNGWLSRFVQVLESWPLD